MASDRSSGHSHEHGDQADSKEPTTNATPGGSPPRNQLDSSPPSADTIQSSPNGKHASVNEVKLLPPPPGAEAKSLHQGSGELVGRPWTTGLFDCTGNQSNSSNADHSIS